MVLQRKAVKYLEITIHDQVLGFVHIQCAKKQLVSIGNYQQFFASNKDKFDIIFIDGTHTEEQVLIDIDNAFGCLEKNGVIILHDCLPPDSWHQRDPASVKPNENWNGNVWKAVLRTFNQSSFHCFVLDMDWGCGIIDTAKNQVALNLNLPQDLNNHLHFPLLLEYKCRPQDYLQKCVKVFYHLACIGNWMEVFTGQIRQLQENGFNNIHFSVLGSELELNTVYEKLEHLNFRGFTIFHSTDLRLFEKPSLQAMEVYAKQNEGYVLYVHSKGVSNAVDTTKVKWRNLMMKELVQNWEYCMLNLPNYDAIGVNWRVMPPVSHFCGNFWYASTRYLRKLQEFNHYYEHPRYRIWDAIESKRLGCEFWISSGREVPKVLSLFCSNVDFCNQAYWKNMG